MKTLSLWQPWASLIAADAKRIETRGRRTKHRGALAIHAARRPPDRMELDDDLLRILARLNLKLEELPLGAVVATCNLHACVDVECLLNQRNSVLPRLTPEEEVCGNFAPGRFAWLLDEIKPLAEPVPARGKQGLWTWEPPK